MKVYFLLALVQISSDLLTLIRMAVLQPLPACFFDRILVFTLEFFSNMTVALAASPRLYLWHMLYLRTKEELREKFSVEMS